MDWEPPAKIPRVSRSRPFPMGATAMAGMAVPPKPGMVGPQHPLLPKLPVGSSIVGQPNLSQMANTLGIGRGRGRPPVGQTRFPDLKAAQAIQQQQQQQRLQAPPMPGEFTLKPGSLPYSLVPLPALLTDIVFLNSRHVVSIITLWTISGAGSHPISDCWQSDLSSELFFIQAIFHFSSWQRYIKFICSHCGLICKLESKDYSCNFGCVFSCIFICSGCVVIINIFFLTSCSYCW